MNVVIVESPAKAKTINKYLGPDYTVLASYGHVRDLPSKDGSVDPDNDFAMRWEIDARSQKQIREISAAVKKADHLFLATDPDREGEAISWHVLDVLEQKKLLKGVEVKRVVFNEITKSAILEAFEHPRDLDLPLIDAYLARRALDYLVGFTLSPVLWRKLPGSRSAGRVQSVALRLICERETEIELFKAQEYWSIKAAFNTPADAPFTAQLTHFEGTKLEKMSIGNEQHAKRAVAAIEAADFSVNKVERKQSRRNPSAPFTTSTLQQDASRKLYFTTKRTMQVAQRLYEGFNIDGETVGLITYMRTDGVQISNEAISATRELIGESYGSQFLPASPRIYKTKAKNAQEAHEAVRPTDVKRKPADVARYLDDDQRKLYELIWKRAVASQMEAAVIDQVAADLLSTDGQTTLRATGSVIAFDGFLKVYQASGEDKKSDDDRDRILPDMKEGEAMRRTSVEPNQHFTQPPPRYSEASLVKTMEELGIGRPSTYSSIISVLQDRNYVTLDKRRFQPDDRGRLVTAFLSSFFSKYVEYNFTAELEEKLDDISGGRVEWKAVLREFWESFSKAVEDTKELRVRDVLDNLNELLGPHFFHDRGDGTDPRSCPTCDNGQLSLKLGKFGAFIGCSNYSDCRYTRPLVVNEEDGANIADAGPVVLGKDPVSGLDVSIRKGPYGTYVQLGEVEEIDNGKKKKTKTKPKRASLPRGLPPADVDLDKALGLLALPRDIGILPETGDMIQAGLGRFGPYLKYSGLFLSLKGDDDVLTIGINRAIDLIEAAPKKDPPKVLGDHPKSKKPVSIKSGRWGPFVSHGMVRANIPKGTDADTLTLEEAVALADAKAANGKNGKKKPAAKKKPAKKKTAKKKAPKKKAAAEG
jgi:DNA topoisomerase-1